MRQDRADLLLAHRIVARRRAPGLGQWRFLRRLLTPGDRRLLGISAGAAMLGLALLAGAYLAVHIGLVPADGGEYREGAVGSPKAANPVLAGGNDADQDIVRLVFRGLYRRDEDGDLALDIADRVSVSPDGKTYSFALKEGLRFHDGSALTADDVVFTIGMINDPAWKSPLAKNMAGISAAADGPNAVNVSSNLPSPYLPSLLTFGILPKRVWEGIKPGSPEAADRNLRPIGNGPFRFDKFTVDRSENIISYTLRKADRSAPGIETITFKYCGDYDSAVDMLAGNEVDGLSFAPPGRLDRIAAIPGISVRALSLSEYSAVFLNPKKNPPLADAGVRSALAYAVDRRKIINEALGGRAELRDAPIAAGDPGSAADVTDYAYDPARAAKLLDDAGYKLSEDGKERTKTETPKPASKKDKPAAVVTGLKMTLTALDTEENRRAAEIIKEGWEAVGIPTEVIPVAPEAVQKSVVQPREYDALLLGEMLPSGSDPYPYWSSSQIASGLNLSAYSNRRIDELLEKARLAASSGERDKYLQEFCRIVSADAPAIFLYEPDYLYPQSEKIRNFAAKKIAAPADRLADADRWYMKLKLSLKR